MASRQAGSLTWEKLVGHSNLIIEYQLTFNVNFSNGLFRNCRYTVVYPKIILFHFFWTPTEIYDVIMESQQFECNGFKLNPVLRMAIMRKVIYYIDKNDQQ